MKRLSALYLTAVVLVTVVAAYGQAPKRPATDDTTRSVKPNEVGGFMRRKLDHSQKVLEGIVLKDFKMIAMNSEQMALLTEDENWMVLQTSDFRTYSAQFKQIANRLTKDAKEKNLDGAALDYVQLTLNCVDCHKHVRDHRD